MSRKAVERKCSSVTNIEAEYRQEELHLASIIVLLMDTYTRTGKGISQTLIRKSGKSKIPRVSSGRGIKKNQQSSTVGTRDEADIGLILRVQS